MAEPGSAMALRSRVFLALEKLVGQFPHVSSTQSDQKITVGDSFFDHLSGRGEVLRIADVSVSEPFYLSREIFRRYSRDRFFAGRIDREHDQNVRVIEGPGEILFQGLSSGIT